MQTRKQRGAGITGLFRRKSKTRKSKSRSRSLVSLPRGVESQRVRNALGLGRRYSKILLTAHIKQQEELPVESLEIIRNTIKSMTRMYNQITSRENVDEQLQIDFDIILYDLSYILIELIEKYTRPMNMSNIEESSFDAMLREKLTKYKGKARIDTVTENVSRLARLITSILDYEPENGEERNEYDMFALELVGEIRGVLKKHKKEIGKIKQELYRRLIARGIAPAPAVAPAPALNDDFKGLLDGFGKLGL